MSKHKTSQGVFVVKTTDRPLIYEFFLITIFLSLDDLTTLAKNVV